MLDTKNKGVKIQKMKTLPQQGKDDCPTWRISRSYSGLITESRFPPVPLKDSESKTLSSSNTGERNFYRSCNQKMIFRWRASRALKLCILAQGAFDWKAFFLKNVSVRFPSQHHLIIILLNMIESVQRNPMISI